MDPRPIRLPWRSWRYLAEETAVVGGRGSTDVPGGRVSMMQMVGGVLGASSTGEELGAPHVRVIPYGQHLGFCVEVGDGRGFGTSRGDSQGNKKNPSSTYRGK